MKTLTFKTNINCGGCIATVKPFLDNASNIKSWEVDTNQSDKILTVKGDNITETEVTQLVQQAGFKAEPKKGLFGKLFS